jgi:hypothetical protein
MSKMRIVALVVSIAFLLGASEAIAASWSGPPPCSPVPCNNVDAPVNVGSTAQEKTGALTVDGNLLTLSNFGANNVILFGPNAYLNVGGTSGSGGYGFRDNAGTLEFKNSGGSWAAIGSGAPGTNYWQQNGNNLAPATIGNNVGIGTTNPTVPLDVVGDIHTSTNIVQENTKGLFAKNSGGTLQQWMWPRFSDDVMYTNIGLNGWNIRNNAGLASIIFAQNGGNVGISNTNPLYKLDVAGDANATRLCIAGNCQASWPAGGTPGGSSGQFQFNNSGSFSGATVYYSGTNVGVGIPSPVQKLDVAGNINVPTGSCYMVNGSCISGGSGIPDAPDSQTYGRKAGSWVLLPPGGINYWQQNGNNLAPATIGNNIGIGIINPTVPLDVVGDIHTSTNILQENTKGLFAKTSVGTLQQWMWPRWSDDIMYTNVGPNGWNIRTNNSATSILFIQNGGNVGIGNAAPGFKLDVGGTVNATQYCIAGANCINTWPAGGAGIADAPDSSLYARKLGAWVALPAGSTNYWTLTGGNLQNNSGTKVGINTAPQRPLSVFVGSSAGPNSVQAIGYQPSFEMFNQAGNANWYVGLNDADANKLYIGRGYGPNQGIAPVLTMTQAENVGVGLTTPVATLDVGGTGLYVHGNNFTWGIHELGGGIFSSTNVTAPKICLNATGDNSNCITTWPSGGGGAPGGSVGQVQYNAGAGAFGGAALYPNNDQGGSVELGGTNTAANLVANGQPYFDFHFGTGAAQDFNTRMINWANNSFGIWNVAGGQINLVGTSVGINTNTPLANLTVFGTSNSEVMVEDIGGGNVLLGRTRLANGTIAVPTAVTVGQGFGGLAGFGYNGSAYVRGARILFSTADNWAAGTNGSIMTFDTSPSGTASAPSQERMRIDQNGNVGIGTTVPLGKLSVMDTLSGLTTGVTFTPFHQPGVVAGTQINASDSNGSVRVLELQSGGGNVGIGLTIPAFKLDVAGDIAVSGTDVLRRDGANGYLYPWGTGYAGNTVHIGGGANTNLYVHGTLQNNDTHTIGGAGGVITEVANQPPYIQTSSGTGTTFTGVSSGSLYSQVVYNTCPACNFAQLLAAPTFAWMEVYYSSGSAVVAKADGGGSYVWAGQFLYNSDRRLKKDIAPLFGSLAKVEALQPVTYQWIDQNTGKGTQIGFIAQDVENVVPQLVHTEASTTLKSVDYARVTPLLVGAVQELNTKIDAQQKEIDELKAEINALKK